MRELTAREIGRLTGGELRGDEARVVRRAASLEKASLDALSFVASPRYLPYLQATRAGVVLIKPEWLESTPADCTAIVVPDPHRALRAVLEHLQPPGTPQTGVHATAVVAGTARLGDGCFVGPYAVIDEGVEIGVGCRVGAHSFIGRGCVLGADVTIHSHVTLYHGVVLGDRVVVHSGARVGKEGFGFVWEEGAHRKIPQVGGCVIEPDVEIGANVTIDRGSIGDTVVGAGTKIDNLVHIGHNAKIGRNVLIVAQVGISGSSTIGDGAVLAGQVGVAGHLEIGPGARLGAQAGVISDVPAGETYSGYPARPHREALRAQASLFRMPELLRRLKRLEEAVFSKRR